MVPGGTLLHPQKLQSSPPKKLVKVQVNYFQWPEGLSWQRSVSVPVQFFLLLTWLQSRHQG